MTVSRDVIKSVSASRAIYCSFLVSEDKVSKSTEVGNIDFVAIKHPLGIPVRGVTHVCRIADNGILQYTVTLRPCSRRTSKMPSRLTEYKNYE